MGALLEAKGININSLREDEKITMINVDESLFIQLQGIFKSELNYLFNT